MSRLARYLTSSLMVLFTACRGGSPPASVAVPATSTTMSMTNDASAASAAAARTFVAMLPDSTRPVALHAFDDTDRTRWFFIPTEQIPNGRMGLVVSRMAPRERDAAFTLLHTALSDGGYRTARAIMANEAVLGRMESAMPGGHPIRDSTRYFVTVFDTAARDEPWGWRVEGHHLSVNVTGFGTGGPYVVAPLFMGANPHRIPSGPNAGARLLAAEEDVARSLLGSLSAEQRARAIVSDTTYGEMRTRNDPKARALPREGLAAADMTEAQRATLRQLLSVYSNRMSPASARAQWQRIEEAGFGNLHFVWAGSSIVGKAHYYRIHGPTVLVEYDNSQNNANHSHTVWRDLEHDFGGDLLRAHYLKHQHSAH
jgi:hypothetical protein